MTEYNLILEIIIFNRSIMFRLEKGVVFDHIGNESLVHLPSGVSFALNQTGTIFLSAAIENNTEEAVRKVSLDCHLPEEQIRLDAIDFIAAMASKGILSECEG